MDDAHRFLETLAIVLCTAAVTSVLFQRLRQPVVLGYLLAGMLVGPHVPVPIDAHADVVRNLAELGVVLLMFVLGIEFSLPKLWRVGPTIAFVAVVECSFMIWLGYSAGQLFGWSSLKSFYAGAMLASASTTVIVKAYNEQNIRADFTRIVFGVLLVDDLIAILLIVVLTTISAGESLTALQLATTAGRLALFLCVALIAGVLLVPRLMRAVVALNRMETTVIASVGLAFGFALAAVACGYSVALGAFIAGSLVAESGVERTIKRAVEPVRDIFAAIFFVSVGMLIDPSQITANWPMVAVFVALVLVGRISAVTVGTFLAGQSVQNALKVGMSMAQIGEFSFIIVGVGLSSGSSDQMLYSLAVAVSGITTLLTPWLIRAAAPTAAWVDRKLPRPLQTFAALYGDWIDRVRARQQVGKPNRVRGLAGWLLVDAVVIAAIVIGASVEADQIVAIAAERFEIQSRWTRFGVVAAAALLSAPFAFGIVRGSRYLGFELALRAFPAAQSEQLDLAAAPRRLLVVALQLAIIILIGVPLVAITQPFVPPFRGAGVLLLVLTLLAFAFWRGATNFQGHTRAAVEALAEMLSRQTQKVRGANAPRQAEHLDRVLDGLGSPETFRLPSQSAAVGKTLAQIKLRGLTGATVLAIQRGDESVVVPSGHEQLQSGDVLAIAGTKEAVDAAKELLALSD